MQELGYKMDDFGSAQHMFSGQMVMPSKLAKNMQRMPMNDAKTNIKFVDNDSSTAYGRD